MQTHKAKKSLGQNFLKSGAALREIVKAGDIKPADTILEIGPGKGALTERLLEQASKVIAVEKDRELISFLEDKFANEIKTGRFVLVCGDILEIEPDQSFLNGLAEPKAKENRGPEKNFGPAGYKIIANIPYNITGAILKKFLTEEKQPELMVLLVQKEVADRIIARDHKESLLSLSVKVYGTPTYIMKVGARYFSPAPKVDSAVIKISSISRDFFIRNQIDEVKFWELLRAGFAHKRKILSGNLKSWRATVDWQKLLADSNVPKNARAEDLIVDNWISVCKYLE